MILAQCFESRLANVLVPGPHRFHEQAGEALVDCGHVVMERAVEVMEASRVPKGVQDETVTRVTHLPAHEFVDDDHPGGEHFRAQENGVEEPQVNTVVELPGSFSVLSPLDQVVCAPDHVQLNDKNILLLSVPIKSTDELGFEVGVIQRPGNDHPGTASVQVAAIR